MKPSLLIAALAVFLVPTAALAIDTPTDVPTGVSQASGGAVAAHAHDNSGLTVNPASIALVPRYGIALVGGFWNGRDLRLGGSAVDGLTTQGIALGLAYQRTHSSDALETDELPGWGTVGDDLPTGRRFDTLAVSLAVPLADDRVSLGLGGQVLLVSHAVLGNNVTGDLSAGVGFRPTEEWSIGLAAHNILPSFFATDRTMGVVLGTRYAWQEHLSVALDVDVPVLALDVGVPLALRGGFEFGDELRVFGLGYRYEGPVGEHWLTFGGGVYSSPDSRDDNSGTVGGLHYAAQVPLHGLSGDQKRLLAIQHTLTITIVPPISAAR